jgi:hypothetical protein
MCWLGSQPIYYISNVDAACRFATGALTKRSILMKQPVCAVLIVPVQRCSAEPSNKVVHLYS